MIVLFRFLLGYVVFEGVCNYPSKFINMAKAYDIKVWNVVCKNSHIKGCAKISDYALFRKLSKRTGLHVHIVKKAGLPFILHRNKKHIGIAVGTVLAVIFLCVASMFVWRVDVLNAITIGEDEIENVLADCGVKPGTYTGSVNPKLLEEHLTENLSNIAWVSVNLKGSVVEVVLNERTIAPEIKDESIVSDLVAKTDGQVIRTEIYGGSCTVKENDVVKKGDILVNGIFESEAGEIFNQRSSGKVIANTIHIIDEEVPFICEKKTYLPGEITRKAVEFMGLFIPYKFSQIPNASYDVKIDRYKDKFIGTSIGINYYDETFYPYEIVIDYLSVEEAGQKLEEKINELEESEFKDIKICSKEEKYQICDNAYKVRIIYVCQENIAEEQKIDIIGTNTDINL